MSSIPIKDASNGFRLFSRELLNEVNIESKDWIAYSLELLAKCNRLKYKISEIPAQWEERSEGSSRFKVFKWLPQYLKWYIYGLTTTWLGKKNLKKNILVTGGSGFIGSAITKYLVNSGYKVIVFDNNSRGKSRRLVEVRNKIKFVKGDIRNKKGDYYPLTI